MSWIAPEVTRIVSRSPAAGHSLDETFRHPRRPAETSLRWVYGHMIVRGVASQRRWPSGP